MKIVTIEIQFISNYFEKLYFKEKNRFVDRQELLKLNQEDLKKN